jgi:ribosome-associated protein
MAAIEANSIRVTPEVSIPREEILIRVSRSSGPGGQHAQRSETRVEAVFDVEASSTLTEEQKRLVVSRAGPVLRAVAQDERSQLRNRELALERLVAILGNALRKRRPRRPTRPTAASVDKRREAKKRRSAAKRRRREPGVDPG